MTKWCNNICLHDKNIEAEDVTNRFGCDKMDVDFKILTNNEIAFSVITIEVIIDDNGSLLHQKPTISHSDEKQCCQSASSGLKSRRRQKQHRSHFCVRHRRSPSRKFEPQRHRRRRQIIYNTRL